MPKNDTSEKRAILKKELGGRGFIIQLSTSRENGNLVARFQVTEAATNKSVAKLVTVAKVEDVSLLIGFDAPEGVVRDLLAQLIGFADTLRELVPAVTIREE